MSDVSNWRKRIHLGSDGVALSVFSILYGATLYRHPTILETYEVYSMIRDVVDSHKIGLVFVFLGVSEFVGITCNIKWVKSTVLRLLMFIWIFFLLAFVLTPPPNSVWVMAALFVYLSLQAIKEENLSVMENKYE